MLGALIMLNQLGYSIDQIVEAVLLDENAHVDIVTADGWPCPVLKSGTTPVKPSTLVSGQCTELVYSTLGTPADAPADSAAPEPTDRTVNPAAGR